MIDCASQNGWHYFEPGSSIELCGAACRDFQAVGVLEAIYHCKPDCAD